MPSSLAASVDQGESSFGLDMSRDDVALVNDESLFDSFLKAGNRFFRYLFGSKTTELKHETTSNTINTKQSTQHQ